MAHYQITTDQISSFRTQGFLVLKNAIPEHLLHELQVSLAEFNDKALAVFGTSSQLPNTSYLMDNGTPLLSRVNDLISVSPEKVLDLLASPAMMAIARDLSGPNTIPLQCDALIKHPHPESVVLWHQDAVHPRTFPYLNIGIYLDDAEENDGCLRYVKGSQHQKLDLCSLVKQFGWDIPETEEVPVKAGDILIQDMMVLHGSRKKHKPGVRRTIYVEMRSSEAELGHQVHSEEWIELRKRWMGIVTRRSSAAWPEDTHGILPIDLKSDEEEIEALLQLRESPIPANYCFEGGDKMQE